MSKPWNSHDLLSWEYNGYLKRRPGAEDPWTPWLHRPYRRCGRPLVHRRFRIHLAQCPRRLPVPAGTDSVISCKYELWNMKKDIVWLDYSRFIGIFLVVFCHSFPTIPGWIEVRPVKAIWDYVYLFHMPLFFIVSGYLYKQGSPNGLRRLWIRLIVPYFLYQLFYLPIQFIHFKQELTNLDFWIKIFVGMLSGDGYDTPISYCICLPWKKADRQSWVHLRGQGFRSVRLPE